MKFGLLLTALSAVHGQEHMSVPTTDAREQAVADTTYWVHMLQEVSSLPPTTLGPTPAPTGICDLEVEIFCSFMATDGSYKECSDLVPVAGENKYCGCPDCVQGLRFLYTGNMCNGLEGCVDSPGPVAGSAFVEFFECGSSVSAFQANPNDGFIELNLGGSCLPNCMDVVVRAGPFEDALQSFRIDTTCDGGRELGLKQSYASLDFVGYTCSETEAYNCDAYLEFLIETCNIGSTEEILFEVDYSFNGGEAVDLLFGNPINLSSNGCTSSIVSEVADICSAGEYVVTVTANATNPETNLPYPCEDTDEYRIAIAQASVSPTPVPTTPPAPTPAPSPAPSISDCEVEIEITPECPVVGCEWNRCIERPYRLEFRVVPAPCNATTLRRCPVPEDNTCTCDRNRTLSEDEWPSQEVFCTDDPDGVGAEIPDYRNFTTRPASETFWIVSTPEKDPSIKYFERPISFGIEAAGENRFNATDPNLFRVEANSYLRIYDADPAAGGRQLQEVKYHSSCSQELWLFDVFGSFQLVEFESIQTGVTGSFDAVNLAFNLTLSIDSPDSQIVLDSMVATLVTADAGLIPTQEQEFDVADQSVPPSFVLEWDVGIVPEVEYQLLTSIAGEVDGVACGNLQSQTIFCPRVTVPGETPPSDLRVRML